MRKKQSGVFFAFATTSKVQLSGWTTNGFSLLVHFFASVFFFL